MVLPMRNSLRPVQRTRLFLSGEESSAKRLRHPDADRIVPMRRGIRKSLRRAQIAPQRAPRSALRDALGTRTFDDRRRSRAGDCFVRRRVTVFYPLGHIADHVVNTE